MMKALLLIASFFIFMSVFSQKQTLVSIVNINQTNFKKIFYLNEASYAGISIKLDSTNKFDVRSFDCFGRSKTIINNGIWSILNDSTLELKSGKGSSIYNLYLLCNKKLFLIKSEEKATFITEVRKYSTSEFSVVYSKLRTKFYSE